MIRISRLYLLFVMTLGLGATLAVAGASAQGVVSEMRIFRIGTGGIGGTYYPIGGLIAHAISNPPGSRPCDQGGSCGVPGLVAIAQSANGSVANVRAIGSGDLESGFVQSDIAYWASTGTGMFKGRGPIGNLRAIASLYPESVHLVVRKGAGIRTVADLRGKRVSLDEPGSGTLVDARLILQAYGLSEHDFSPDYLKPIPAIAKMKAAELDAFFIVSGFPTAAIMELANSVGADLVSIDGPQARALVSRYRFFSPTVIPAGTYAGIAETRTVSVDAQWVVAAEVDEDLVYAITRALWNRNTRRLLDDGHAIGRAITLKTALNGIAIPLHPG
ncbi:MAG: TAXI family TRAP transporter solute-binding subunit, partial [Alphaproteobacteria bacterium]